MKTRDEFISWLLTHAGVESDYNRNLIYNTAETFFKEKLWSDVLALGRQDLPIDLCTTPFSDITINLFGISDTVMYKPNIILFVDFNGDTIVLKNRYGDRGIVNHRITYLEKPMSNFQKRLLETFNIKRKK